VAVDEVSFEIARGETLGLVGESGCGKSTLGRLIVRLEPPDSGKVLVDGKDVWEAEGPELLAFRRKAQIVFQDPYSSLNPRIRVGEALEEALFVHGRRDPTERSAEVSRLLSLVGLDARSRDKFPHEFSGGQRQRVGIARALSVGPELLVCDEAVSALDVSIQAQILNLLCDLKAELGLTMLFIAHGLGAVKYVSDRIAVMREGRIVEIAPTEEIFASPRDPYTKSLLDAFPIPDPRARGRSAKSDSRAERGGSHGN
jgi:peptide/nickel transport system ATP-binding protein/oligopeptide transport system ATP-binding protein